MPPKRREARPTGARYADPLMNQTLPKVKDLKQPLLAGDYKQSGGLVEEHHDLNPDMFVPTRDFATGQAQSAAPADVSAAIRAKQTEKKMTDAAESPSPTGALGFFSSFLRERTTSEALNATTTTRLEGEEDATSASSATSSLADRLLRSTKYGDHFARYLQRQIEVRKSLISKDLSLLSNGEATAAAAGSLAAVEPLGKNQVIVRPHHPSWCDLVAVDYLTRTRHLSGKTRSSMGPITAISKVKILVAVLIAFFFVVLYTWPMWNLLLDIDANKHYETLGLSNSASPKEVKKAYRELAKKWHPDSNPGCGQSCTNKMMQIQEAHDVLLAKGSEGTRSELKKQYDQALSTLLGLVFFRGVAFAFFAANTMAVLLSTHWIPSWILPRRIGHAIDTVLYPCAHYVTPAIFLFITVFFVSGFNISVLAVTVAGAAEFYSRRSRELQDARERDGTGRSKAESCDGFRDAVDLGNFDAKKNIVLILFPAILAHVVYFIRFEQYPQTDVFVLQLVYGSLFLMALLAEYPPNLWDNVTMMRWNIPSQYLVFETKVQPDGTMRGKFVVTTFSFIRAEAFFVVSDVFAFCAHVAAPFRFAAIVAHALFLAQAVVLHWEKPKDLRTSNMRSARMSAAAKALTAPVMSAQLRQALTDRGIVIPEEKIAHPQSPTSSTGGGGDKFINNDNKEAATVLSEPEVGLIVHLDREPVVWLDLPLRHNPDVERKFRAAKPTQSDEERHLEALGVVRSLDSPLDREIVCHNYYRGNPLLIAKGRTYAVSELATIQLRQYAQFRFKQVYAMELSRRVEQWLSNTNVSYSVNFWSLKNLAKTLTDLAIAAVLLLSLFAWMHHELQEDAEVSDGQGKSQPSVPMSMQQASLLTNPYHLSTAAEFGVRAFGGAGRKSMKGSSGLSRKEKLTLSPSIITPRYMELVSNLQFRNTLFGKESLQEIAAQQKRRQKAFEERTKVEKEEMEQSERENQKMNRRTPRKGMGGFDPYQEELLKKMENQGKRQEEKFKRARRQAEEDADNHRGGGGARGGKKRDS